MKRIWIFCLLPFFMGVASEQDLSTGKSGLRHVSSAVQGNNLIGNLVINEFMAGNSMTLQDPQGQYDDWLELYNRTEQSISVNGMYLTDDPQIPLKWSFPDTSIEATGYLLIWIDDDEEDSPGLHANFHMNKDGEYIGLYDTDADGNGVIDSYVYGLQTDDVSMGRFPNGEGSFVFMVIPTPDAENVYSTAVEEFQAEAPAAMSLFPNYPNPFNGQTVIPYAIGLSGHVHLSVIDFQGRCARVLVDGMQSPGNHMAVWDGCDSRGRRTASGIYLVRLTMHDSIRTQKMVLVQ
jgi:hypothetical protein